MRENRILELKKRLELVEGELGHWKSRVEVFKKEWRGVIKSLRGMGVWGDE
jgi:hypothetical protein